MWKDVDVVAWTQIIFVNIVSEIYFKIVFSEAILQEDKIKYRRCSYLVIDGNFTIIVTMGLENYAYKLTSVYI